MLLLRCSPASLVALLIFSSGLCVSSLDPLELLTSTRPYNSLEAVTFSPVFPRLPAATLGPLKPPDNQADVIMMAMAFGPSMYMAMITSVSSLWWEPAIGTAAKNATATLLGVEKVLQSIVVVAQEQESDLYLPVFLWPSYMAEELIFLFLPFANVGAGGGVFRTTTLLWYAITVDWSAVPLDWQQQLHPNNTVTTSCGELGYLFTLDVNSNAVAIQLTRINATSWQALPITSTTLTLVQISSNIDDFLQFSFCAIPQGEDQAYFYMLSSETALIYLLDVQRGWLQVSDSVFNLVPEDACDDFQTTLPLRQSLNENPTLIAAANCWGEGAPAVGVVYFEIELHVFPDGNITFSMNQSQLNVPFESTALLVKTETSLYMMTWWGGLEECDLPAVSFTKSCRAGFPRMGPTDGLLSGIYDSAFASSLQSEFMYGIACDSGQTCSQCCNIVQYNPFTLSMNIHLTLGNTTLAIIAAAVATNSADAGFIAGGVTMELNAATVLHMFGAVEEQTDCLLFTNITDLFLYHPEFRIMSHVGALPDNFLFFEGETGAAVSFQKVFDNAILMCLLAAPTDPTQITLTCQLGLLSPFSLMFSWSLLNVLNFTDPSGSTLDSFAFQILFVQPSSYMFLTYNGITLANITCHISDQWALADATTVTCEPVQFVTIFTQKPVFVLRRSDSPVCLLGLNYTEDEMDSSAAVIVLDLVTGKLQAIRVLSNGVAEGDYTSLLGLTPTNQLLLRVNGGFDSRWQPILLRLVCDQGYENVNGRAPLLEMCAVCPIGSFSSAVNSSMCTSCTSPLLTGSVGSVGPLQCNICSDDFCHSHGHCFVGETGAACQCQFGYYASDRCAVPWLLVVSITLVMLTVCGIFAVNRYFAWQKRSRAAQAEFLFQIEDLKQSWIIDFQTLSELKLVAGGGFGSVYIGAWCGRAVAVKMMHDIEVNNSPDFEREARTLRKYRHPQIVLFFGVGQSPEGQQFLVTEFVDRGSLRDVLDDSELADQLTWPVRLNMAVDIATGVEFLHRQLSPVIHRDLKSPNVLVTNTFRCKIGDLGTSRLVEISRLGLGGKSAKTRWWQRGRGEHSLLRQRAMSKLSVHEDTSMHSTLLDNGSSSLMSKRVGTTKWAAPEMLRGDTNYGLPVDIYACGIVFWEIATGNLPFEDVLWSWEVAEQVERGKRPVWSANHAAAHAPKYMELAEACWHGNPQLRPTASVVVERVTLV